MQRFGDPGFHDQPRDSRRLRPIDPQLDAGVVADRDIARLQQPLGTVFIFDDRHGAVLERDAVAADGTADGAFRHEISHGAATDRKSPPSQRIRSTRWDP